MKLEFSWQIVEKCPDVEFHENPSIESLDVERGLSGRQGDRHDEASSRFYQVSERACKSFGLPYRILSSPDHRAVSRPILAVLPFSYLQLI